MPKLGTEKAKQYIEADKLLEKYATRVQNTSYSDQQRIRKVLLEEAGGDDSEYESDFDELSTLEDQQQASRTGAGAAAEGGRAATTKRQQDRIFKYLTIQDKMVMLPPRTEGTKLTVFFELDDVFLHTFLCDENFGYMAKPE